MDQYFGYAAIVGMCVIVLSIVAFRKRAEILINFIFRAVLGSLAIYFINQVLDWQQVDIMVGLNPVTILTSGSLGVPGVFLLYGINLCKLL